METKPLVPLNKALFFLKDIIKVGNSQFIDSKGKLFKYTKSKFVNLEFKEITKIIPILTGGALIEVDNENPRYKVIYAPSIDEKYVGMLQVSPKAFLVYGFYTEKYEDTRRKI